MQEAQPQVVASIFSLLNFTSQNTKGERMKEEEEEAQCSRDIWRCQ
jgi:hypothetical protein